MSPSRASRPALRLLLLAALATGLALGLLEFSTRALLSVRSGAAAFRYGFDHRVEAFPGRPIQIVTVQQPAVERGNTPPGVDPEDLMTPFEAMTGEALTTAFAFGGSTTAGRHCSGDSSSWVAELAVLKPGLFFLNFAVPGSNTERSLGQLRRELAQENSDFVLLATMHRPELAADLSAADREKLARPAPDLVFWANWINERNAMFSGPMLETGIGPASSSGDQAGGGILFLHRLHATLEDRSAAWLLLTRWGESLVGTREATHWAGRDPDAPLDDKRERDIGFAMQMTLENLATAHAAVTEAGSQLVVVRPPISWPQFEAHKGPVHTELSFRWNRRLFQAVSDYAEAHSVVVLDPHGWMETRGVQGDDFCDGVHLTRQGHRRMAQAMLEEGQVTGIFP